MSSFLDKSKPKQIKLTLRRNGSDDEVTFGVPCNTDLSTVVYNGSQSYSISTNQYDNGWSIIDTNANCSAAGGKAAKKVTTPKGERVVRKGPRGGEYVIYKGEKVSASRFAKKKSHRK
jgi:hypothetical protein